MMTAEEIEERFGISQAQVEEWSAAWERGELPGEPVGEVTYGRPLKFGEPLQVVTFKDTEQHVSAMDRRAHLPGPRGRRFCLIVLRASNESAGNLSGLLLCPMQ